ncbi:MAG: A24 family peptidase [Rickettsiales bacterium]
MDVTFFLRLAFQALLADAFFRLAKGCVALYGREEWNFTLRDYVRETVKHAAEYAPTAPKGRALPTSFAYWAFLGLAAACVFAADAAFPEAPLKSAYAALLALPLLSMGYVDIKLQYLPDFIMAVAVALSLAQTAGEVFLPWKASLAGGAVGFGLMWGINAVFKLVRKKDGMGAGDFKLTGTLGLWLGVAPLPYLLFLSSFIGLSGAIGAGIMSRSGVPRRFAYGPALALAGYALILLRDIAGKYGLW